ncbi:MAG: hypothetical protein ACPGUV_10615, partial [Polyangiales bacterium]
SIRWLLGARRQPHRVWRMWRCSQLTVLALMAACGGSTSGLRSRGAQSDFVDRFHVSAPYVATLINALEAAADIDDMSPALRQAYLGKSAYSDLEWLSAYRDARSYWNVAPYYGHVDASFVPHLRCSYEDATLQQLLRCMHRVLPGAHVELATRAVLEMDALLEEKWPRISSYLGPLTISMQRTLRSDTARRLVAELKRFMALPQTHSIDVRIVVVAKPPGSTRLGRREERYLIVEADPSQGLTQPVVTVFHELAHFLAQDAPQVAVMEREFAKLGRNGMVAAHHWNEAVATAFEHLVATTLDPGSRSAEELYGDPTIDGLARALSTRWRRDRSLHLGPRFARELSRMARHAGLLKGQWRLKDLLFRVATYANDINVIRAFRSEFFTHTFWGVAPVPGRLQRPRGAPPTVPKVVFLTARELQTYRGLLRQLQIPTPVLRPGDGPLLHWSERRSGVPTMLVVGQNNLELRQIARDLGRRAATLGVPPPGWHSLYLDEAPAH